MRRQKRADDPDRQLALAKHEITRPPVRIEQPSLARDARTSTTKWARRPQQAAQAARRVQEIRRSPCKTGQCPRGQRKQVREHEVLHDEKPVPGRLLSCPRPSRASEQTAKPPPHRMAAECGTASSQEETTSSSAQRRTAPGKTP